MASRTEEHDALAIGIGRLYDGTVRGRVKSMIEESVQAQWSLGTTAHGERGTLLWGDDSVESDRLPSELGRAIARMAKVCATNDETQDRLATAERNLDVMDSCKAVVDKLAAIAEEVDNAQVAALAQALSEVAQHSRGECLEGGERGAMRLVGETAIGLWNEAARQVQALLEAMPRRSASAETP